MNTTLNKIKSHRPCKDGWEKLVTYLGKTEADDDELSIATIIESNGIKDAIWALRAVDGYDKEIRLFAANCAESVLHLFEDKYPGDDRPRKAIQAARDYANGLIDAAARVAAGDASGVAAWAAAWAAAGVAAWAAAKAASGDAAWDAARAAAWDAAWDAARAAAWDAAGDASGVAAWAAAWVTSGAAAGDAAGVTSGAAAWAAEREKQKQLLLEYINP